MDISYGIVLNDSNGRDDLMTEYRRALKNMLLAGSTLGALASGNAVAQEVSPDGASTAQVEEIVVTARRREESLQDVPISVTAFTADALDQKGAPDITALQLSTPNLTLQVSRSNNSTLTDLIRGIGQQDPLWGFSSTVRRVGNKCGR